MTKTLLFLFVMVVLQDPVATRLPVQAGSLHGVAQTSQVAQAGSSGREARINLSSTTPTEGSTYFLLGGGLIGLAIWTRRRRA